MQCESLSSVGSAWADPSEEKKDSEKDSNDSQSTMRQQFSADNWGIKLLMALLALVILFNIAIIVLFAAGTVVYIQKSQEIEHKLLLLQNTTSNDVHLHINNSDIPTQLDEIVNTQNELRNQQDFLLNKINTLQMQAQVNASRLENKLSDTDKVIANISRQFQEVDNHLSSSLSNLSVQFTTFAMNVDGQLSSINSRQNTQASELRSLQSDLSTLTSQVSDIPQEISNSFGQRFSDVDSQIYSIRSTANLALRKADANENRLNHLEGTRLNGATTTLCNAFVLYLSPLLIIFM